MEIKNDKLSARLVVPDHPTVREQLAYFSETIGTQKLRHVERLWIAARALITEWECPALPDIEADLDKITSPAATDAILWAAMAVKRHMDALDDVPKN